MTQCLLILLLLIGAGDDPKNKTPKPKTSVARVAAVIDGRTLILTVGGKPMKVRLAGVEDPAFGGNTDNPTRQLGDPSTGDFTKRDADKILKVKAHRTLKQWCDGKPVTYRIDDAFRKEAERDGYARVYLYREGEDKSINVMVVSAGLGRVTPRKEFAERDAMVVAASVAQDAEEGMWAEALAVGDLGIELGILRDPDKERFRIVKDYTAAYPCPAGTIAAVHEDGWKKFPLTRDLFASIDFSKFVRANDTTGIKDQLKSGEVFVVEDETPVRVLQVEKFEGLIRAEVRILEGEHKDRTGWVAVGYLVHVRQREVKTKRR